MYHFRPEDMKQMILHLADKHKGYMHSLYWNWHVLKLTHPRYSGIIEQPVPVLVIDFK